MRTTHVQIIMSSHVNGANRLFGGQLMEWIDVTAAVEARRHAKRDVTLAAVDAMEFIAPVQLNDTIVLAAEVTWTGRSSLEVRVEVAVEHLDGRRQLVNRAYLVFVALDADGRTCSVEPFRPQTPEQKLEWDRALQRRENRLRFKKQSAVERTPFTDEIGSD